MATPRMRTFISGLVLALPTVGLTAPAPGRAVADVSRSGGAGPLPGSFRWSSTGPLIFLKPAPRARRPTASAVPGRRWRRPRPTVPVDWAEVSSLSRTPRTVLGVLLPGVLDPGAAIRILSVVRAREAHPAAGGR
ncbi:hypothetical protein [Streptomyces capitiformicae]|uniref:hypothetical protein n=1 Tax=Streptomyces capitiformicae TaxID=2014920 RepID=UPI001E64A0E6|nr:hypothetical protein [Streptomyces capitiformicae]